MVKFFNIDKLNFAPIKLVDFLAKLLNLSAKFVAKPFNIDKPNFATTKLVDDSYLLLDT